MGISFVSTGSTGGGNALCFFCPSTAPAGSATPANPAPPQTITPSPSVDNSANLVFTQSAYGGVIPIVFGSDLLPGNVIWASPFVKHTYTDTTVTSGNQQKFYYTVNIAIAICEGEINALLRLYSADQLVLDNTIDVDSANKPLPTPNGSFSTLNADLTSPTSPLAVLDPAKRKTKITIFDGSKGQTPPKIMQDQEGYDYTPAYRGTAYLLIENLLIADSIPSLTMEVSSNTSDLLPRQIGDPSGNTVLKVRTGSLRDQGFMSYMPGYDIVFSMGSDDGTTNIGAVVWSNNLMTVEKESVFHGPGIAGLPQRTYGWASHLLPSGNLFLCGDESATFGNYYVWSPFYDAIASSITNGGTSTGLHSAAGPSLTGGGTCVVHGMLDRTGTKTVDVVCIPDRNIFGRANIALLTITNEGAIDYTWYANDTTTVAVGGTNLYNTGGRIKAVPIYYTDADFSKNPAFPDGGSTKGAHVYYFSTDNILAGIYVDRLEFDEKADGSVSVTNPRMTNNVHQISFDDLGGSGVAHNLAHAFCCPSDNTCILCIDFGVGTQAAGCILKYDPITARVVWRTLFGDQAVSSGGFITQPGQLNESEASQDVSNDKWAWTTSTIVAGELWSVDLNTGIITKVIADLAAQGLPTAVGGSSMYNGKEDSIIYQSNGTAELVKVFLTRKNRQQAALTTIVKSLLNRVDWRAADTTIQGIDTLAVDGYTVSSAGATLRQIFDELRQVFTFDIVESNGEIAYKQRGGTSIVTISETKMQLPHSGGQPWLQETHEYDITGTRKISVTYRDIDREYKSNVQSIQLPKYSNLEIDEDAAISVNVPIVLDSETAKKLAEILLYAKITYQTGYDGTIPQKYMPYDPSDVVTFTFNPADGLQDVTMRIRQMSIGADWSIKINGTREDPDIYTDQINLFGNLGRYTPQQLARPPSRVEFTLLQVPFFSETQANQQEGNLKYPVIMALTSFTSNATLPKDNIVVKLDTGESYDLPAISAFPTWGFVSGNIGAHGEIYTTQFNKTINVNIQSTSGALLGSCTDYFDMVNNRNKNLAVIGNEIIQFQTATNLGNNVWQLSVIARGLFGTEQAVFEHKVGDKFILIYGADGLMDTRGIKTVAVALGSDNQKSLTVSMPSSTTYQPPLTTIYKSLQFTPWVPGGGKMTISGTDMILTWQYRSRLQGQWSDDGSETPDVPFSDAGALVAVPEYTLYLTKNAATFNRSDVSTYLRKVDLANTNTFTYTAAMQTADGYDINSEQLVAVVYETNSRTDLDESIGLSFIGGPKVS